MDKHINVSMTKMSVPRHRQDLIERLQIKRVLIRIYEGPEYHVLTLSPWDGSGSPALCSNVSDIDEQLVRSMSRTLWTGVTRALKKDDAPVLTISAGPDRVAWIAYQEEVDTEYMAKALREATADMIGRSVLSQEHMTSLAKGRVAAIARGVKMGRKPLLTSEQKVEIAKLWATGYYTQAALGAKFGVGIHTIRRVLNSKPANQRRLFTPEQEAEISKLYATGDYTFLKLGAKLGVSQATVYRVVRGK